MTQWTLADLSEKMRDIDFTMLITKTNGAAIAARPMSNNRDVDYDGDSWFFTTEDTLMVSDIAADPQVGLSFQGKSGILGQRPFFDDRQKGEDYRREVTEGALDAHMPNCPQSLKDSIL
uniref:pyridoxamine 5'-phosphate oxidase family protein n=1 Tax=Sphingomonas sp. TaxID=28214 RepID=UPI003B3B1047